VRHGVIFPTDTAREQPSTTAMRWGERGVWKDIFEALAQECDDALVFIDASIIKAHRATSGSKKGRWRRVLDAHTAVAHVRFMRP